MTAYELYKRLNLTPEATPEEIRKAFLELAKQLHPDKTNGETEEEFKAINEAYQILSNPSRKQLYDASGMFESTDSMTIITNIQSVIFQILNHHKFEIHFDLIGHAVEFFNSEIQKARTNIKNSELLLKKYIKIKENIVYLGKGDNILSQKFDNEINTLRMNVEGNEKAIEMHKTAIKILKDYNFNFEKVEQKNPTVNTTTSFFVAFR